jgi:hypothetical protein
LQLLSSTSIAAQVLGTDAIEWVKQHEKGWDEAGAVQGFVDAE